MSGDDLEQKDVGKGPHDNIDMNSAILEEFESDVGNATKKHFLGKDEMDVNKQAIGMVKKIVDFGKVRLGDQSPLISTKSSKMDDLAMRLLQNLSEMNEYREVSLARFGLVPTRDTRSIGKFKMHPMLETWTCHLL